MDGTKSRHQSKLQVWNLDEFFAADFPEPEQIIEELLRVEEMVILSAPAKTGKSHLGANFAIGVASRTPVLGKRILKQGRVLIWQTEIPHGEYRKRIAKMLERVKEKSPNIYILGGRIRIDSDEGISDFERHLKSIKPILVLIDPLYTLHKCDEDSASEMAPMLSNLRDIVRRHGAALILIHHQGKRGETKGRQTGHRHRGSSALADVPDSSFSLEKSSERAKLSFEMRNVAPLDAIPLKLESDLWWQRTDHASEMPRESQSPTQIIVDLLRRSGGSQHRKDLIKEVHSTFGIGQRNCEKIISQLLGEGTIAVRKEGKEAIYSIVNAESPNERSLLGECTPADVVRGSMEFSTEEEKFMESLADDAEFGEFQ